MTLRATKVYTASVHPSQALVTLLEVSRAHKSTQNAVDALRAHDAGVAALEASLFDQVDPCAMAVRHELEDLLDRRRLEPQTRLAAEAAAPLPPPALSCVLVDRVDGEPTFGKRV